MLTFLFDLDGTLVITDSIYFSVWKTILSEFNIVLTDQIFRTYIQGNNDKTVMNSLLGNISVDICKISETKDRLFIQNIHQITRIDGVSEFLQSIKDAGYNCGIVTNCNQPVADAIIKAIQIDELVDYVVTANNCIHGKPHSEPYLHAIELFKTTHDQCIIFEDSKSGILSAQSVHPRVLIGMETIYTKEELHLLMKSL